MLHIAEKQDGTALGTLIAALLFAFGLYFPTSINGDYSPSLAVIGFAICLALLIAFFMRCPLEVEPLVYAPFLCIVPLVLLFTFTSGLSSYTPGALAPYAVISVLYLVRLREFQASAWFFGLYLVLNVTNIFICGAILAGFEPVTNLLNNNYSAFYPDLVINMLFLRKPILTFGTHSLAGLFLYLFFYLNQRAYRVTRKKIFLFFSVCYLVFTWALLSVTGLVLGTVATAQMVGSGWSQKRRNWLKPIAALLALEVIVFAVIGIDSIGRVGNTSIQIVKEVLTSRDNGFLGRWLPGSVMYFDIDYLYRHPLSPVGVSYRPEFNFVDCGILEHALRGSVFLVALIYGGLFSFLRRNLIAKGDAYFLFLVLIGFEIGFSSLTFFRTLYLIPIFVICFNELRRIEAASTIVEEKGVFAAG
jgi:hypothetical protein